MSKRKLQAAHEYAQINDLPFLDKKARLEKLAGEIQEDQEKQKPFRNKQRVLVFSSRGSTSRYRYLINDLRTILPHSKKEIKMENKDEKNEINEICELRNCNNCIYLEVRKKRDCYLWMSKIPHGPSIKFHVENVHTLGELKLTGNCLLGSRPLLIFDKNFDLEPQWQLIKEVIGQIFNTPKGHPGSKPFHDHVFCFFLQDNRIWFRNYQIIEVQGEKNKVETDLVEIGPRFVLNPIRMLGGSFSGITLYLNGNYISPNEIRSKAIKGQSLKYIQRTKSNQQYESRRKVVEEPIQDELDDVFEE